MATNANQFRAVNVNNYILLSLRPQMQKFEAKLWICGHYRCKCCKFWSDKLL